MESDPRRLPERDARLFHRPLGFPVRRQAGRRHATRADRPASLTWTTSYGSAVRDPLTHVALPRYTPGCDSDPRNVACDYQPYDLEKIARKGFAESGSSA